jgi:cyclic pyranopterin monophosphate synthase
MLSHVDKKDNPTMVDVSGKSITSRKAIAQATIWFPPEITGDLDKNNEIVTKKGPVFQTAIIAGTMAAKKTSELIPFCHQINLDNCRIKIEWNSDSEVLVTCEVKTTGKTGVEMEALTGASVAALTIYDMCKALSHHIIIQEVRLIGKFGGKSDITHKNNTV